MKKSTSLLPLACGALLLVGAHPAFAQLPPTFPTPTPAGLPVAAVATPTPTPTPRATPQATPVPRATPATVTFYADTPAPATGGTLPAPTPLTGTVPAPTPTPGGPVLPSLEAANAQASQVSGVRRLIRDVQSNTDNVKAVGNFGAQLYLIDDQTFYQDWNKPETPTIAPVSLALHGQPIYTVIIFYGPARDAGGLSNVSYDLTVRRPDGSVLTQRNSMVGWQALAPDERQLHLGRNYLTIVIPDGEPSGLYTVDAVVHDNNTRVTLPLKQTFAVQ